MAIYLYDGKILTAEYGIATHEDCCCEPCECPPPYDVNHICHGCPLSFSSEIFTATISGVEGADGDCDCEVVNGVWKLCRNRPGTSALQCDWQSESIVCDESPLTNTQITIWYVAASAGNWDAHWRCSAAGNEWVLIGVSPCDPTGSYTTTVPGWWHSAADPLHQCTPGDWGTCVIS